MEPYMCTKINFDGEKQTENSDVTKVPWLLVATDAIDVSLVAGGNGTPRRLRYHNTKATTPVNNTKPPTTPKIQAGAPMIDDASMLVAVLVI